MAPKILAFDEKYDPFKSDVWSSGISLYSMLYGYAKYPWYSKTEN